MCRTVLHRRWLFVAGSLLLAATMSSADPPTWNPAAARHLLSRAGFGGTAEQAERQAALPLEKAVDALLEEAAKAPPPSAPSWVRETWINGGRRWSDMSPEEYLVLLRRNSSRHAEELGGLRAWWLQHMISTATPLREEMTLFWHGHFTSATGKVLSFAQSFYQQNQTWRKHALGNYREFLEAVTLDPCMMAYLDMERSSKDHPNENYARELLELFSLGVGNYTEKDILEIARAFTGWDLDAPKGSVKVDRPTAPDRLQFPSITRDGMTPRFQPKLHDDGTLTILGRTGKFGVKEVLDVIVEQPACGRYLAGRMIEFFGVVDADGKLCERMAKVFRASRYEIRPMVRELLISPEFYAEAARGNRIKSPVRLLVGACRDLQLEGKATPSLAQLTVPLGQELFNPPTVKGWPSNKGWISASTLTLRYRLGETLLEGKELTGAEPLGRPRLTVLSRDKAKADATTARLLEIDAERKQQQTAQGVKVHFNSAKLFPQGIPDDSGVLVDTLLARLIVTRVRPVLRQALIDACHDTPINDRPALVARLILASPEYQLH